MRLHTCLLTAACAVGFLGAAAAAPQPHFATRASDAGPTKPSTLITTSIILNVTDRQALEQFVADTTTPGSPDYHRFLTVDQFRDRFAPSDRDVAQLVRYLESFGITIDKIYPDNLDITATGTAGEFAAVFSTQLHDYTRDGHRFHRPEWKFVLPGGLSSLVLAAPGLDNEPGEFRPKIAHLGQGAFAKEAAPAVTWRDVPGEYTVRDFARFYDVNPLYQQGIDGGGETVGIMTLANFRESDVYAYWRDVGLTVPPHRITKVMVDGGTPIATGAGDDETSLDVEQSGGIAPQANIRVYIAANTLNGFLDLFYTAASENAADTVSISWGQPEEDYFSQLNGGVDYTDQLTAMDQALLEGAAQGQSFFAASGDSGAYDINNPQIAPVPLFSKQLTVDAPASDPYITAAGGTTIAATEPAIASAGCPAITIPAEQVWGWDYLASDWAGCLANLGITAADLFPVGGGGGVSSFWPVPFYQQSVSGIELTQWGQSLIYYSANGPEDLIDLKGGYAGRNVPDLSLNADPQTGYIVVDCTDFPPASNPGCASAGWGGTSFAAPQLNGVTALIDEAAGGRVGLLNPAVYWLQRHSEDGRWSPFNDITTGDNWFYSGEPGYDNGSGIGSVDAARLAYAYMMLSEQGRR